MLTFAHRQFPVEMLGTTVPLGLVAGLAIVAALVAGFRLAFESRGIALAAGTGVVIAASVLAFPGAGGSLVVLADPAGLVWLFGSTVLVLAIVAWPARRQAGRGGSAVIASK